MKIFISGNEAFAEASIKAGCRFYAGYPITPQNELIEYMSDKLPKCGGVFIQAESELAAINMVFGAAVSGVRAMTSSSSPGISLKQEAISYLAACQLPAVIVNVMRGGPGLGNIAPAQADYFQATRGGGHGDYRTPVFAPASVSEVVELTFLAFDIADRYRTPVILLGDGMLGQMMESVDEEIFNQKIKDYPKPWALTGCQGRPAQSIKSLLLAPEDLEELNISLQEKYRTIEEKETRFEEIIPQGTELILIAYGTVSRICRQIIKLAQREGIKLGLFRPISLWPFPAKRLMRLADNYKNFLVIEMSSGQMYDDVRLAIQDKAVINFYGRMGGKVVEPSDVLEFITKAVSIKI